MSKTGVFQAHKKDNTVYYRSSLTYKGKHISLGSFPTEEDASAAYEEAGLLLRSQLSLEQTFSHSYHLPFAKIVSLINYRDHGIYLRNPIYLQEKFFYYYLDEKTPLKFDIDDLFYYSTHKIQRRGGYLFVSDYGMQVNIYSRYGIKNYSVCGKDYRHVNMNEYDFTYANLEVICAYYGVTSILKNGKRIYKSQIHLNGNYLIGYYDTAEDAAIAYNKAVDIVTKKGCSRSFPNNYILTYSASEYARRYLEIKIRNRILTWQPS